MSQNDFNLANQGFPSMRSDMNSAFQALASNSSGTSAPSTTYAYQWWYDETNDILKMRNADNDAWVDFASFDQTSDTWQVLIGGTPVTASAAELNTLDGFEGDVDNLNATQFLSGRNIIINGSGRINQRSYTSGTNTSGANEYTLDRWRVVTSGQNLTFTGNDAARTMTAPAGGVEQEIEGANITGGTYVISFTGTATCTVDGATKSSGDAVTLTANTNATVRFTSGTFTDVQLEKGDVATPFEELPIGVELARCQRYYWKPPVTLTLRTTGNSSVGSQPLSDLVFFFPVAMRTTPTVSITNGGGTNIGAITTEPSLNAVRQFAATSSSGFGTYFGILNSVDAEI